MTTLKTALVAAAAVAIGAALASTSASATLLSTHLQVTSSPRLPAPPGTRIITPGVAGAAATSAPSLPSGGGVPRPPIHCGFQDYECSR
jgi:hypothetical protein